MVFTLFIAALRDERLHFFAVERPMVDNDVVYPASEGRRTLEMSNDHHVDYGLAKITPDWKFSMTSEYFNVTIV